MLVIGRVKLSYSNNKKALLEKIYLPTMLYDYVKKHICSERFFEHRIALEIVTANGLYQAIII